MHITQDAPTAQCKTLIEARRTSELETAMAGER
jgi:hypothetical protein